MPAGRGFIVWGAGIVVILGLFLIFVAAGWPGDPNDCIYDRPDTCFCERFDPRQVEAGAPGVRQPVNTWFNLYSILTSLAVALVVYFDRKSAGSGRARNVIRSSTAVPDLYIFAVLFLGLGSMWFHGSLTGWGGIFDGVSMYVYAAFLIFYSVRRFWASALFFWIGYLATVALFSFLHTVLPSVVNIMILVAAYLGIEIYIWVRTRKVMIGVGWVQPTGATPSPSRWSRPASWAAPPRSGPPGLLAEDLEPRTPRTLAGRARPLAVDRDRHGRRGVIDDPVAAPTGPQRGGLDCHRAAVRSTPRSGSRELTCDPADDSYSAKIAALSGPVRSCAVKLHPRRVT